MNRIPNRIIGIPASRIETHIGATDNYLEFMRQFGIPRIIMPDEHFVHVDLLVLPGGLDINPASYGEVPGFKTTNTDVFKQFFFDHRLKNYVDGGIPIFGICLGFQQLAAYFGCKLTQNLKWHANSHGRWAKGHEVLIHEPVVREQVVFRPGAGKKKENRFYMEVNSHHHQAVLSEDFNEQELQLLATSYCEDWNEKSIVEAFIHNKLNIAGVQWHPEEWYDTFTYDLVTKVLLNK